MSYKLEKEAFVSNLTGSSSIETCGLLLIGIACNVLWVNMTARNILPKGNLGFLVEFFIFCLIPLFVIDVSSKVGVFTLCIASFLPSFVLHVISPINWDVLRRKPGCCLTKKNENTFDRRIAGVTFYRSQMMLVTVTCILAVDFTLFPRRYAKVETWGTSLMDLGVGSFMFSSGTVAGRKNDIKKPNAFKNVLWNSFILLILGFARMFLTKSINYQEHVSEYGMHWNFFFTLGFMALGVFFFRRFLKKVSYFNLATFITLLHHCLLVLTPFQKWALSAPRTNILAQNREGIASLPGYIAIYFYGMYTGSVVLADRPLMYTRAESWKRFQRLLFPLCILLVLYLVSNFLSVGVSRRLANTPYVANVAFINMFFLTIYILIDAYLFPSSVPYGSRVPKLLEDANNNGLLVFLIANVLTGVVNLSFDTLHSSNAKGLTIMTMYLFIICYMAHWLAQHGIRFRL